MFKLKTVFHIKPSLNHIIGDDWCLKLRFTDLTNFNYKLNIVSTRGSATNDSLGDIQKYVWGKKCYIVTPTYEDLTYTGASRLYLALNPPKTLVKAEPTVVKNNPKMLLKSNLIIRC